MTVVVEARTAALSEAGDILIPLRPGAIGTEATAGNLSELVRGAVDVRHRHPAPGTRLFKIVGMSWQDLVVAAGAVESLS